MTEDPMGRFADAGEMAKALHEGLVSGMADEARESCFALTKLQIWQAVAGIFAVGFFVLLLRALR
jgi:hypothetical protein